MILYCPKCHTGYDIQPDLIPEKGIKMRCAKCGEVWRCTKDDLIKNELPSEETPANEDIAETTVAENSEVEENVEEPSVDTTAMTDIFARLSTQTEELFKQEQTRTPSRRLWSKIKHWLGLDHPGTLKYYLLFLLVAAVLILFALRFEIVRTFPAAEKAYGALGIESRIVGEGLAFQNVLRNEYTEDYVRKMEVKGYIVNTNPYAVDVPLIHVEIMDKDTNLLQSVNDKAPVSSLEPNGRMAFRIVINQPSALAKYILLTFSKQ